VEVGTNACASGVQKQAGRDVVAPTAGGGSFGTVTGRRPKKRGIAPPLRVEAPREAEPSGQNS